ncbi:MAG: UDP-N-acetylmuramoyl-L-alanyl-D-glutamate--2,6-diaminopimelate ligase [Myxococcales bacterium]|nr:UDP-N-acetylmuramoyl-L-alanyl-D-glutamate--2,6-diaminopimelate ligase [Myxococcales bacterium]
MRLSEIAARVGDGAFEIIGPDVDVTGVCRDSRRVAPGDLFAALTGEEVDGERFIPDARAKGAVAAMVAAPLEGAPLEGAALPQLVVGDVRAWLGPVCHAVHAEPTHALRVIGITGTNGKTTVAYLVDQALEALGQHTALLGTVASRVGGRTVASTFTTPEADDLARFAAMARDEGASELVMEVSSHGLALARVRGVRFEVAAFTNLSQDHLDFHPSMEAYGEAKASLFLAHAPRESVVNVDDAFGAALASRIEAGGRAPLTVGIRDERARLRAVDARFDAQGIHATIALGEARVALESGLVGRHNLENLLVALGVLLALGHELAAAAAALGRASGAPGRLERVADPRGVTILVDYAHTPDALANALAAVRPLTAGRLLVVFGCGGDRDASKRPLMGRAAAEGADLVVVTSDNPRTEAPAAIAEAIVPGVQGAGLAPLEALAGQRRGFIVELDRAKAIEAALVAAEPGDTVLIAGKGHEDYQIVGHERRPFDDRAVAAAVAHALASGEER